jgi:hypothetical protein
MNTKLAGEALRHIEAYPQNYSQVHLGEQTEVGTVSSVGGYVCMFGGRAKIKNQAVMISEIEGKVEQCFIKVTAELLEIPYSVSFRMNILSNDEQALEALRYIAKGELPNWREIRKLYPSM